VRIVLTLLVRDEEDILAANLDYHLARGVDFVVVTDNRSVDATPAILAEYVRRGVAHVIHEPGDDYAQARWVTRMARLAATRFHATWVLNGDADEFWWPRDGDLRACLAGVPGAHGAVVARRTNLLAHPRRSGPFHRRLVVRQATSANHLGEPLPPKVCHRADPTVEVEQGNHRVAGGRVRSPLDDGRLEILHVPVRTRAQFERKIDVGGRAYARNRELPHTIGHVWRTLYRERAQGAVASAFARFAPDEETLADGLASGQLALDFRLAEWLERVGAARVPSSLSR